MEQKDDIITPEMTRMINSRPDKLLEHDTMHLQQIKSRVVVTSQKKFNSKTIAELIEWSHMGKPFDQYNIGVELEQVIRDMISMLVMNAFNKQDETSAIVSKLNIKLQQMDALYKTDSERLSELSRVSKVIDRLGKSYGDMILRTETLEACIDKQTMRLTNFDEAMKKKFVELQVDMVAVKDHIRIGGDWNSEIIKSADKV